MSSYRQYFQQNSPSVQSVPPGQFRFNWGRNLGVGGLGRVDEIIIVASNCELAVGDRLACKRLNEKWIDQPEARERFEREIRTLEQMSHPNIVTVRGQSLSGGSERFYVMPLYSRSLRNLMASRSGGFPWTGAAKFVARVADAMDYAHSSGFIHRDLKPENILLTEDNSPVIADWGLGYFIHKQSTVLQHLTKGGMGTEYYCSMEQWNTGKCGNTGDVYSLGVMLAELVLGYQSPIQVGMGIDMDVLGSTLQSAQMLNNIIKTMTDLIPTRRIQSMQEVARQLRTAVSYADYGI